jgi:hypothetical protein
MTSRLPFIISGAVVAALAIVQLACGTRMDMDAVSKAVSDGISSTASLPVASVSCPTSTRFAKEGSSFQCLVTPRMGGTLTVKVTETDAKGNVKWEVVSMDGLVDLKAIENAIQKRVKQATRVDATASCGGTYRLARAGESFDCEVKTQKTGTATMVVTMTDDKGNVTIGVKQ